MFSPLNLVISQSMLLLKMTKPQQLYTKNMN